MARAIMIQGAGSDVGKSLIVAGLVRAAARRGAGCPLNFHPGSPSTSWRAAHANKSEMVRWGVTVTALLVLGSIPLFVGLAFVLPWLGYSTWHLYTRLIDRSDELRDYADTAALIELMQTSFRPQDLAWATELADALVERFEDATHGGFFFTGHDHERLIHRPKPGHDNATPAGNGIAAQALTALGHWLGEPRYLVVAERAVRAAGFEIAPGSHGFTNPWLVEHRFTRSLRWTIERCLAKEPDERFASTKDLARDLRSMRDHLSETSAATLPAGAVRPRRSWLAPAAAALPADLPSTSR